MTTNRLNRADVESQISEMWDALQGAYGTPDGDQAFAQAHKIEADLRARLAAQDRLDEAAFDLYQAAKAVLAWADHSRAFVEPEDCEVLNQVNEAVEKAGEQPE